MLHRVSFEFRLTRLLPWAGDGSEFRDHVESVREKIAAHEFVAGVHAIANQAESLLTFDFVVDAPPSSATDVAVQVVATAIENCDARHFGMGSGLGRFKSSGASSGLETPIWHQQRVLIALAA
jgi:hypothetical protein